MQLVWKCMSTAVAAGAIGLGGLLMDSPGASAQVQPAPPAQPNQAPPAQPTQPALPETLDLDLPDVVARVNEREIEGDELEQLILRVQQMAQQDPQMQQMGMPTATELLDELVNQRILHVIADDRGYEADSAEVDAAIDEIKQGLPDPDMFELILEQEGFTEASFRDQIGQELVINQLIEALADDIEVTQEEMDDQYDELQLQIGPDQMPAREDLDEELDNFVRSQKQQEQLRALIADARGDMDIEILISPNDIEIEAPTPLPLPQMPEAPQDAPAAPQEGF